MMKKKKTRKARTAKEVRALKVLHNLDTNGGSLGSAMVEEGYSPATAKNTSKLTRTKSFLSVLEEAIPIELVAVKHKALLNRYLLMSKHHLITCLTRLRQENREK